MIINAEKLRAEKAKRPPRIDEIPIEIGDVIEFKGHLLKFVFANHSKGRMTFVPVARPPAASRPSQQKKGQVNG